jgi:hypothetical protein
LYVNPAPSLLLAAQLRTLSFFPLCLVLRPERISPSFSSFLATDFRRLRLFVPELLSRRGLDEERKRKKERKKERKKVPLLLCLLLREF